MSTTPPPMNLLLPVDSTDHALGPDDAPVTLLEYGDYECPYCGRAFPIIKRLQQELDDRLRVVYRHFPQNTVHPRASVAAQAVEAAGAQGKFWEMHDMIYQHQDDLSDADFVSYALKLGLDPYQFQSDLASERFTKRVENDHAWGVKNGIKKTPTLFINGVRYGGPLEYDALLASVRGVLPG
jgi:formate-nitrite transporter family protein